MIQETIDRLKQASIFKLVGGSAQIDTALTVQKLPAAFVIYGAETASGNTSIGDAVTQQLKAKLLVLLAVTNAADVNGSRSVLDLMPLRDAVKSVLIGWSPNGDFDPYIFETGSLLKMDEDGILWWVDSYITGFIERHV